jgi:hypothetical protein
MGGGVELIRDFARFVNHPRNTLLRDFGTNSTGYLGSRFLTTDYLRKRFRKNPLRGVTSDGIESKSRNACTENTHFALKRLSLK